MTEAPVLSKKQQNQSLSAKKTKTKTCIKNVLATPFKKSHWPCICEDHYNSLKAVLEEDLPRLVPEKVKISWKEMKHVPRNERKKFRQECLQKQIAEREKSDVQCENRDGLILGVNDVSKALENSSVSHILITAEVEPRILVKHVINQAIMNKVPTLVMPYLRTLLKAKCGISSMVLGFRDHHPKYSLVQTLIEEMATMYPVDKRHPYYSRAQNDSVMFVDESNSQSEQDDSVMIVQPEQDNTVMIVQPEQDDSVMIIEDTEDENKSVYLTRTDKTKRVFVPETKTSKKEKTNSEVFIPFSYANDLFTPLRVTRMRKDENRKTKRGKLIKIK